jgi:Zn-dependent protease
VSEPVKPQAWWSRGIPLGRLFGVPVSVTPSWFVSLLVIALLAGPVIGDLVPSLDGAPGYLYALLLAVMLGVSVLFHELGHCAVAKRQGVGVVRIELFLLGGVSEISRVPRSAREEAGVAAAGPVVSAVLTGVFAGLTALTERGSSWWLFTVELALANGIITVFNLLPALPLDGGRILRAGVWRGTGNRRRGTLAGVAGGYLVAALLIAWSVWRLLMGGQAALVQGVIGLAMAGYIAVGARSEQTEPEAPGWPAGVTVNTLARPALNLPAETPVELALRSAAGREVILIGADGVAEGILDPYAATSLARHTPQAPAGRAAQPIGPDTIVLFSDGPAEVSEQLRTVAATHFLLIGEDGMPQGVLRREDIPRGENGR